MSNSAYTFMSYNYFYISLIMFIPFMFYFLYLALIVLVLMKSRPCGRPIRTLIVFLHVYRTSYISFPSTVVMIICRIKSELPKIPVKMFECPTILVWLGKVWTSKHVKCTNPKGEWSKQTSNWTQVHFLWNFRAESKYAVINYSSTTYIDVLSYICDI